MTRYRRWRQSRDGPPARVRATKNFRRRAAALLGLGLVVLIAVYIGATVYALPHSSGTHLRYDEFLNDVRSGKVQSATVLTADRRISGTSDGGAYWLDYGTSDNSPAFSGLLTALQQGNVQYTLDQQAGKALLAGPQVSIFLPSIILVDAIILTVMLVQGGGLGGFGRSGSRKVKAGESKITFADVAGVDEPLEELAEIRDFLSSPERFLAMGARIPRGILLIGPPGCGKTLLARAVAGEAEAQFFSISGSAFVEMYVGVGAARIRDLFREAQEAAPSIVFIDELDAVGRGRATGVAAGGQDERESTLNQLLVGLDGFDREVGVVVIAATNRPDVLDTALLRPGRFDRRIVVELPDIAGRLGILGVHCRGKPVAPDVNLEVLARRTPGFSGADLSNVVNEAALLGARRGEEQITNALLWEAVERLIGGPERRSRLLGTREKQLIAYHEAGHALASALLLPEQRVSKISLMARGKLGVSWYDAADESHVATRRQLEARLAVTLAGRAAEELACDEVTSAASDDLERATDLARRMVCELGMSDELGPVSLRMTPTPLGGDMPSGPSPDLAGTIDSEIRGFVRDARQRALSVLERNRALLDRVAERLQEAESLQGDELDSLLYPVGLATGA